MAGLIVKGLILMPGAAIWLLSWLRLMGNDVPTIPPDASWFDPDAERQHPDLPNLLKYPGCEEFLLGGAPHAGNIDEDEAALHWRGFSRAWFPNPELAIHPNLRPPAGKWPQESGNLSCKLDQTSWFNFDEGTKDWGGFKPKSMRKHLLRSVSGRVYLAGLWESLNSAEVYSTCKPDDAESDDDQLSIAVFEMQGALLSMGNEWRLYMMGCADRPPLTFPGSSTKECSMMLKAKIPKVVNILHRQFEGELTSMKTVDDPKYFPPVSIFGFQDGTRPYQFAAEETVNNSFLHVPAHVDSASMHLSESLTKYLESQCLEGGVSLSMKEQQHLHTTNYSQLLQLGPFNAAYNPVRNHSNRTHHLAIRITLKLEDVHCQASALHIGTVLVSGILTSQVSIYQSSSGLEGGAHWSFISVEQKPLAVEGAWNRGSGELHMVGCCPTNFTTFNSEEFNYKTLRSRCDWKLSLHSVLRDSVTIDSPEGAVLSSLHEDDHQHPKYFNPLRFTRLRGMIEGTWVFNYHIGDVIMFSAYRYTHISKALALAKKNRSEPEFAKMNAGETGKTWFPAPVSYGGLCCEGIHTFQSNMMFDVGAISLAVTDVESCTGSARGRSCLWRTILYEPNQYLKVAVRFNILLGDFGGMMNWQPPLPHRAEGVYEPHTGQMHLVANVQLAEEDGGNRKSSEPIQHGSQVYIKVQYAQINPKTGASHPLQFHMESLRSPWDPLYFPPLQFEAPKFESPPKVQSPLKVESSTFQVTAKDVLVENTD